MFASCATPTSPNLLSHPATHAVTFHTFGPIPAAVSLQSKLCVSGGWHRRQTFSAYRRCRLLGRRRALALTPPDNLRQPFSYHHACRTFFRPCRRLHLGDSLVGIVDEVDARLIAVVEMTLPEQLVEPKGRDKLSVATMQATAPSRWGT